MALDIALAIYLFFGFTLWLACVWLGFVEEAYHSGVKQFGQGRALIAAITAAVVITLLWPLWFFVPSKKRFTR